MSTLTDEEIEGELVRLKSEAISWSNSVFNLHAYCGCSGQNKYRRIDQMVGIASEIFEVLGK